MKKRGGGRKAERDRETGSPEGKGGGTRRQHVQRCKWCVEATAQREEAGRSHRVTQTKKPYVQGTVKRRQKEDGEYVGTSGYR